MSSTVNNNWNNKGSSITCIKQRKSKKTSNSRSRISSNDKEMIRMAMMVPVLIQTELKQ